MEDIVDNNPVPAVEKLEITSSVTTGSEPIEPTTSKVSGGGDGTVAPCAWSLTKEQQVYNLKKNWIWALTWAGKDIKQFQSNTNPWFERIVAQLRIDPCYDGDELETDKSLFRGFVWKMTSLDLAVMMEDLEMVKKILGKSYLPNRVTQGYSVNVTRLPNYDRSNYKTFFRGCIDSSFGFLYTPLHLAIEVGSSDIVDMLLEKKVDVNAKDVLGKTPLDIACEVQNIDILQKLLEKDEKEKKNVLHVVARSGCVDFMRTLPSLDVNAKDRKGNTPLHYLAQRTKLEFEEPYIVEYLARNKTLDVKASNYADVSIFYTAILNCRSKLVIALLDTFKGQMRLHEICDRKRGPPIQIAYEGGDDFKDIKSALMDCDPIINYMDRLYRDRQVNVDAANAILVGAALIASVTFASWLQPPLNYTSYFGEAHSNFVQTPSTVDINYVDVEHNIALRAFWVFNALSFYFAIGTVVFGARSVIPRNHLFIEKAVEKLDTNLLVTSILLACSMLFVIIAFAIAGTIVLTPLLKYQWYMIVPTIVGGMVCIISLVFLIKSIVENYRLIILKRRKRLEG